MAESRAASGSAERSPFRAVALGNQVPRTLRGEHEAIAIGNCPAVHTGELGRRLDSPEHVRVTPDARVGRTGKDAFEAMKIVSRIHRTRGASRPETVAGFVTGRTVRPIRARRRPWPQPATARAADQGRRRRGSRFRRNWRLGSSRQRESAVVRTCCASSPAPGGVHARIWATAWKTSSW